MSPPRQTTGEKLAPILESLPGEPGVYQFYNADGQLLYVGKAKHLKRRVSSYFHKAHDNARTELMVRQVADIRYILVESEYDALLLENNLIKKHQPRYNVNLKDDKTYPWIIIKNEPFPRVFYTRRQLRDGSHYFGPYASVTMIQTLLELIRGLYPLRTCTLKLTADNIRKKKFKVCLEYHIGNCKGPCEGLQDEADYGDAITGIRQILKGNTAPLLRGLKEDMLAHSDRHDYEAAQALKEKIQLLEGFRSKSIVVHPSIADVDVFSIINTDPASAYVNFLKVNNGSIVQARTVEVRKKLDESDADLLALAIVELRGRLGSRAAEIIVPVEPGIAIEGASFTVPRIGDKKHLLELSLKNAFQYRKEKMNRLDKADPAHRTERVLARMQADLRMKEPPRRIECFDNSNFQGAWPVAAMSVFVDGRPARSEYRHFNIRTVGGPDDFASMEEVIGRRYKRLLDEGKPLPQLIVIDGGKGQLGSALRKLADLGLKGRIAVIGLAKRLEEIYFPGDPVPMYLDKKGETLKVIQRLRDEAHRFGIRHHRNRRSKGTLQTELLAVPGIGEESANALLKTFRSVKKIREADAEALAAVVGKVRAQRILDFFANR